MRETRQERLSKSDEARATRGQGTGDKGRGRGAGRMKRDGGSGTGFKLVERGKETYLEHHVEGPSEPRIFERLKI